MVHGVLKLIFKCIVKWCQESIWNYVGSTLSSIQRSNCHDDVDYIEESDGSHSHCLNLKEDYTIQFERESLTLLLIRPTNPLISDKFRDFKISCPSRKDVEQWFQALKKNDCLMTGTHSLGQSSRRSRKKVRISFICFSFYLVIKVELHSQECGIACLKYHFIKHQTDALKPITGFFVAMCRPLLGGACGPEG